MTIQLSSAQAKAFKERRARMTMLLGHRPGAAPPRPKRMAKSTGKREVQQDLLAAADTGDPREEHMFEPFMGPSLNSIYGGVNWNKRKKQADEVTWPVLGSV